jgi:hypothetical protein
MKYSLVLCCLLVSACLLVTACSPIETSSIQEYLALAPTEPSVQTNQRIQAFTKLYDQLDSSSDPIDESITTTYAEKFYFNDTLVTLHDRQNLLKYLKQTQQNIDAMNFKVLSVQDNGQDAYVRWLMKTQFKLLGQEVDSQSIGFSHLRFNADNKIILHQDYWDNMQGFYQHIPIIGGVLRWIKNSASHY